MDTGRIALLLRHVVADERLDSSNPRSHDDNGGYWSSFDMNDPENYYGLMITHLDYGDPAGRVAGAPNL